MRSITSNFQAQLSQGTVRPRLFFEADLTGTTLRYCTDIVDIVWNSFTWSGNGHLIDFGAYQETEDSEGQALEVTLAGEPSALVSLALQSSHLNQLGKLWFAFLDANYAVIADPHSMFVGELTECTIDDSVSNSKMILHFEPCLARISRDKRLTYTDAAQKVFYPSDRGFEYIKQLQDWIGYWGKPDKTKNKSATG